MFFNKQIMLFDEDVNTSTEIITDLADELKENNIINDKFLNHVLKREMEFPTGLATNGLGVAIPHTDSKYVNESQIAFATLKNPINFKSMVDLNKEVPVSLVFMIAMASPHEQAELLSKLMSLFQDSAELENLKSCKSKKEVIKILNKHEIV
ncbi:PTS sugar transporter subunit IIA [Companilactobacillus zhachilii]|uniref:PTS sugar transporter subunit IIA n=1 Tax=Companilactobacillus zhachilii TaxID=2304606 RepID=UPI004034671F